MAKQLLGKEVTAALNEKIKANVAELEAKGVLFDRKEKRRIKKWQNSY